MAETKKEEKTRNNRKGKTIKLRYRYGLAFFIFGGLLLIFSIFGKNIASAFDLISAHIKQIVWCAGASFVGVGAGIINSRDRGSKHHKHYWIYFVPFVFPMAILSGLVAGLLASKDQPVVFYLSSLLVSISVGFSGDSLAGKVDSLKP